MAPLELTESAGNVDYLIFTSGLTFCGVVVLDKLPGFWKLYRVSPFTYIVNGFLSNDLANSREQSSPTEFVRFIPPSSDNCAQYIESYIIKAGAGYLADPLATENCEFCAISSTNDFLRVVGVSYDRRWRNVGIFIAFILFDIIGATFLYWLARVPKKADRVKCMKKEGEVNVPQSEYSKSTIDKEDSTIV